MLCSTTLLEAKRRCHKPHHASKQNRPHDPRCTSRNVQLVAGSVSFGCAARAPVAQPCSPSTRKEERARGAAQKALLHIGSMKEVQLLACSSPVREFCKTWALVQASAVIGDATLAATLEIMAQELHPVQLFTH